MNEKKKKESNCPVFGLYKVSRILMRAYTLNLEPFELTYPQFLVMKYLWINKSASVDEIGSELLLDSGTLTPLLKRLQSKGLLSRARDPEDERRCIVALTSEGIALESQTSHVREKVVQYFNFGPELIKDLNDALNRILDVQKNKITSVK